MNKLSICTILLMTISTSFNCHAGFKRFEAPIDEAEWQFSGNPTACTLSHVIPMYGNAHFSKVAGREEKLQFRLGYKRHQLLANKTAAVISVPPSWHPIRQSRELGEISLTKGPHIIKSEATASWRLLNELETGRFPTFYYQDFSEVQDQVSVALSTVGFKAEYGQFLDCLANLVPYKLNELTRMTLFFDFDKSGLRLPYQPKIQALAQFIKHDPSIDIIFINGYTDSRGSRGYNEKLAQKRINSVKNILQLEGVADNRFKTVAYGEKNPAASNRSAKGRAKNRRVVIRISQN